MISSIEYLDIDISDLLSDYINERRKYNNIIKELEILINVNIVAKYLLSFDNKYLSYNKLSLAYDLVTAKRKTRWLHNWPTKPPSFVPRHWTNGQYLIQKTNEDYIIKKGNWKLKKYPPSKRKYIIERLLIPKN